jgi:hypothetical protein
VASNQKALCEACDIEPALFITLSHLQASEDLRKISPVLADQIMGLS